jgi:hypothetical protein
MLCRWRPQAVWQIDVSGILRGNPRREDGGEYEEEDQNYADGRERVVAGHAGERDGNSGHNRRVAFALYMKCLAGATLLLLFQWLLRATQG